ncbi:hypothetical protein HG535_0C05850 [Zygotorulaspora mrakii]|uniref:Uncharacterized protein n=1 Tax=Zygotorulaspora mrakii TaxID=42260 RepID=A0A7H9B0S4_ZYGMR|nr:uncharacterized protein HG535_0C05850 [Zygotorulaspora mrakii]QLG72231.1 hypothetical protein HG535_0C05850 [Zygotorulaspora mrakii]
MAFKSFKYKFYSKGYHCSAAQKNSTSFFDSSYQYFRQNQGLVSLDTAIPQSNVQHLNPYPVLSANVNYNNLDDVLNTQDGAVATTHEEQHEEESVALERNRSSSINHSRQQKPVSAIGRNSMGDSNGSRGLLPPIQRDALIDHNLSKKFYSTTATGKSGTSAPVYVAVGATGISGSTVINNHNQTNFDVDLQKKAPSQDIVPGTATASGATPTVETLPWEEDTESSLNPSTFLTTHINEINEAYRTRDYNKINPLYQALKRNGIVPPLEVYSKVLESLAKRDLDKDDLDYKMSELLTCYQDMIINKLKPSDEIYNIVLGYLFKGSILAYKIRNSNGSDFYKIASELYLTIDTQNKQHQFSKEVLDHALLAMNLYPGHLSLQTAQEVVNSSPFFKKDCFYYVAFISYAKLTNDNVLIKKLYEEFRAALTADQSLKSKEFEVYTMTLSGLVETGDLDLAIKLLDTLTIELKEKNGSGEILSLMLSNFLISVSKIDCHRAYELWSKFHKMRWIPEFSYEFYLVLLANSFEDWKLSKKIYDCIFPMRAQFKDARRELSDYLLRPIGVESVMTSLLDYALQSKDNEMIMKILEESVIKNLKFDVGVYQFIFAYLKEIKCPDDYLLRFIATHGSLFNQDTKSIDSYEFLNGIIDHFPSQVILKKITEMKFFSELCRNFNMGASKAINYGGLIGCMRSLWASPQTIDKYSYNLEIHAILIMRLLDFDTYYNIMDNEILIDFKEKVLDRFSKLAINYRRLNFDPNKVPGAVSQAIKMIDLPDDVAGFYSHPGDWDKTYPLALGSAIRNSGSTGIKEFKRLKKENYSFDYDTYKELVKKGVINSETISASLDLCADEEELKYLTNTMCVKCTGKNLEKTLLEHPSFQIRILPSLTDESLLRLAKNCSLDHWINQAQFPKKFKSIAAQAEFKSSIGYVYDQLSKNKEYSRILLFNKVCPVLNIEILLKSCIRTGNYELYRQMFEKYRDHLGPSALDIQSEYLINRGRIDEAVNLIKSASVRTPCKTLDIYTFGLFLQSFYKEVTSYEAPEDTLQLANLLSAQSSFMGMLSLYDTITKSDTFLIESDITFAVKSEILEQMLNNLYDATELVDVNSEEVSDKFNSKIQNYFRFRAFLKLPQLQLGDLKQLLGIWAKVNPFAIDTLFNNMVETIYLNPNGRLLYLEHDLSVSFKPHDIHELCADIENFYKMEEDAENTSKVQKFKSLLDDMIR